MPEPRRPTGARIWLRLFRLASRALPLPLRRKHGLAMEALFVRDLERASRAGPVRAAASGMVGLWDVIRRGLYERTRGGAYRPAPTAPSSMESLMGDVRQGIRSLRRSPGFAGASVAILALGIGASTTTFSAFTAVALEDLPVTDPDRLVLLSLQRRSTRDVPLTSEEIDVLGRGSRTLERVAGVATFGAEAIPLTEGDRSLALAMSRVTPDFFDVLGARPTLGRLLRPEDGEEGASPATVLSWEAWHRDFGGDPAVIGRTLTQTQYDERFVIVGVAPPGLDYPIGADYWIPARPRDPMEVIARLGPDATAEAARSEFLSIARALDETRANPRSPDGATVRALSQAVTGDARPVLVAITAAVALLLLLTCSNVGNLLLMRATGRSGEAAVRRALGASSYGLARLFLVEAVLLGVAGGAIGIALATGLTKVAGTLAPAAFPRAEMIALSGAPVAIGLVVTGSAILLFGIGPTVAATKGGVAPALRIDGRSGTGTPACRRVRRLLVVTQVALAVVLLTGAGLVARSLQRLAALDLGYDTEGIAIVEIGFNREAREGPEETFALLDGVQERLLGVPGVIDATPIMSRPFLGGTGIYTARPTLEGQSEAEAESNPRFPMEVGGSGLFRTLGIPLVRGRGLRETDREGAERVAVVSEAVAGRLWPGEDPIGRRMRIATSREHWWTVVGVAGDTHFRALLEPTPTIYVHVRQLQILPAVWTWAVRAEGDFDATTAAIREGVRGFDPRIHVWRLRSLREHLGGGPLAQPRVSALLLSAFGLAALALAALGLYAVVALSVRERSRELGVMMALGASAGALRRAVLGDALLMVATGTVGGLGGALLISRWLEGLLYDVGSADPVTLIGVGAVLVTVGLLAAYLPARRATRADPVRALGSP